MVTALRVNNIAFLRQEFYDPTTGKFVVPAKEGEDDPDGLMKSGDEYIGVFLDAVRRMINAQLVEGHDYGTPDKCVRIVNRGMPRTA